MIKLISDIPSLETFRPFWDEIFDSDYYATPFQHYDYINLSLKLHDNNTRLYIITVIDQPTNKYVAIFPFLLEKNGVLVFINSTHSDFCKPLISPNYNHFPLYQEVAGYINNDKNVKGLSLDNIVADSFLLSGFRPFFKNVICLDVNYYLTVDIVNDNTDKDSVYAIRNISSKKRGLLKKQKNQLFDNGFVFGLKNIRNNDVFPSEDVESLIDFMIAEGTRTKTYFSHKMRDFIYNLYCSGLLSIATLYKDNILMSCAFMFYDNKKTEYIEWVILQRNKSFNMATNLLLIDYLYNNHQNSTINFGRGIYDYKLTNFHPDVKPLFRVMISKNKWGHFKNIIRTAIHYSKPIIKSWLGR